MDISYANQVAVVTGAGRGLGESHARFLASRGARVVVNDPGFALDGTGPSQEPADRVVREIREAGGEAVASYHDICEDDGARHIIDTALETYGGIEVLVNNAGNLRDRTFAKTTLSDFEAVVRTHLLGTVACTHAAWPVMQEAQYGRIVFTTSASGLYGNFGQSAYAAAKMGLVGFMNALKLEGQRRGILINAVAPIAATRMTDTLLPASVIPGLKPELVTSLVAYFCAKECSHTGEVVEAGAGLFAKAVVVEGEGARFDPDDEITPEAIQARFEEIIDLSAAEPYPSSSEALTRVMELATRRSEHGAVVDGP